jgi:hypothetical protein
MTLHYVRSGAAGAATGVDWANAFTTLAAALAGGAAGDSFYVADDHAESTASAVALTSPGTAASPCFIFCVSDAGSVPPVHADLATTGTVATTGASSITFSGFAYCYGLSFTAGSVGSLASLAFGAAATHRWTLEACQLIVGNTNNSSNISLGSTGAVAYQNQFINTTVRFGAVAQSIRFGGGTFTWRNTANAVVAAGSIPTNLFTAPGDRGAVADLKGVDLSDMGSGKTIFGAAINGAQYRIYDCEIDASVTIAATPTAPGATVIVARCAATDGDHIEQLYTYQGTQSDEITIVRTGGATDGETPKSRKIVTTANAKWIAPFEALPISRWFPTLPDTALGLAVGAPVTLTIYGIWGDGAVPDNDEIWAEARYLGSASNPQASIATNGKAGHLATATALTADAVSTWGGSTTAFKMALTFTPQQAGFIFVTIKAGAASATFYIDPKIEVS